MSSTEQINFTIDINLFQDCQPIPQSYFEESWKEIQLVLDQIHFQNKSKEVSYQLVYQMVEELCNNDFDEKLYGNLQNYYLSLFQQKLQEINNIKENQMDKIVELWIQLKQSIQMLSEILKQFECNYLYRTTTQTYEKFILSLFAKQFQTFEQLKMACLKYVHSLILKIRQLAAIDENQLKQLMEILIKLDFYEKIFENDYLQNTQQFYHEFNQSLQQNFEIKDYLNKVEKSLILEQTIIEMYLLKQTSKKVFSIVESRLILDNLMIIFQNGFSKLVEEQDIIYLGKLYKYLDQVNKIEFLNKNWQQQIIKIGSQIVLSEQQDNLIPLLIQFIKKIETITQQCFQSSKMFQNSMENAMQEIFSIKINTVAEKTSKAIDYLLRKKQSKNAMEIESQNNESNIKDSLKDLVKLFMLLPAKDIFEAFFNKRLVRRLLLQMSSSDELEREILEIFKKECGEGFVSKSEEIFKDYNQSKQINLEFQTVLQSKKEQPVSSQDQVDQFSVSVISSNNWPFQNKIFKIDLEFFNKWMSQFNEFYRQKIPGVILEWQYELSQCEIIGHYGQTKYNFLGTLLQTTILMLFNKKDKYTIQELKNILSISDSGLEDLKSAVLSLYYIKSPQNILITDGDQKKPALTDSLTLNYNYKNTKIKVIINNMQKQESAEEIQNTSMKVISERSYVIDACIVKIMKHKKEILFQNLLKEIFDDLKLPIEQSEIKKRLDTLIERDYLERDQENQNIIKYK